MRHVYFGEPRAMMSIDKASERWMQQLVDEHTEVNDPPARIIVLRSFSDDGRITLNALVFDAEGDCCSHSQIFDTSYELTSLTEP
jgi:hypothetical protein